MLAVTLTLALGAPTTDGTSRKALMFEKVSPAERVPNQWGTMPTPTTSLASNSMTWPGPDGKQHDTPFWGSFTPRVAAAAAFWDLSLTSSLTQASNPTNNTSTI